MDAVKGRRGELLARRGYQTPKNELKMTSRRQAAGTTDISILVQCQDLARRSFCLRPQIHHTAVQNQFSVPSDKCYKSPKSYKKEQRNQTARANSKLEAETTGTTRAKTSKPQYRVTNVNQT